MKKFSRLCILKIYPIFLLTLSACTTTHIYPYRTSVADDIFFNIRQGNIVSDCRNTSESSEAIAEIVCYDMYTNGESNRKTFQIIETKLRELGWKTPEPYTIKNYSRNIPSDVSTEDYFVLKKDGADNCNWTTLAVFVDNVFLDSNNRTRMKVSLNKFYDGCDILAENTFALR